MESAGHGAWTWEGLGGCWMGRAPRRSGERFVNVSLAIFCAIDIFISSCPYISDVNVFVNTIVITCARLKNSGGADHFKAC